MIEGQRITVLIPALNEEETLPLLLKAVPKSVDHIIVMDNGSTDNTAAVARASGATVVAEPVQGYGQACLTGLAHMPECDIVVFLDADFCDDPSELPNLCTPIVEARADMVLGSRMHGEAAGHLTIPQRFGNAFACLLMNMVWGTRYTDLGPFRAVTPAALERMKMKDRDFGWTIEMQINAAKAGLKVEEIKVPYRQRLFGTSKISGTINGVVRAGSKILYVIAREIFRGKKL